MKAKGKKKKFRDMQKFGVVALVRDGNGRILMQKRGSGKFPEAEGKWEPPGGKVEFDESPLQAVVREVREETGCEVSVGRLLPVVLSNVWKRAGGGRTHAIVMCYECWHMGGVPRPEPGASTEVGWYTPSQVAEMDTLPGTVTLMQVAGIYPRERLT